MCGVGMVSNRMSKEATVIEIILFNLMRHYRHHSDTHANRYTQTKFSCSMLPKECPHIPLVQRVGILLSH